MNARRLIDTNVLVHGYDYSEPKKQKRPLDLLDDPADTQAGLLSTQVLAEAAHLVPVVLSEDLAPTRD
jgi:predicted nucleic acid-binding protein